MSGESLLAGALDGVNVLELAEGVSGPFCGKLLAGLGARVIKVEPVSGDCARQLSPFLPGPEASPERSALFHHLNTGKESIAADSANTRVRELIDGLVRDWATIVITSESPASAREHRVDWDSLSPINPALLLVNVTDFGGDGPLAEYAGSELVALARGGYLNLTGEPSREPLKPYGSQARFHAGLHAAAGAVAALLRLEATGAGEQVDVSTVGAAAFLSSAAPGWAYFYGEEATRVGNRLANPDPRLFYPSTMRPCRDGWVHAHGNTRHPDLLQVLTGDEELSRPEIVAEPMGHADEIDAILDRWLATRDKRDVVEEAQVLRVPFTEVLTPPEVITDPHLVARNAFVELDHPVTSAAQYPAAPARFSETRWQTTRPPLLGEHTAAVLSELCGLGHEGFDALCEQGAIA